ALAQQGHRKRTRQGCDCPPKEAEADGLDASDYRTPDFVGLAPDALAEADLKLTQAVLTFARHLQAGRFPYARLSHTIHLPQTPPDPAAILARMVDAGDAGKVLDEFAPPACGLSEAQGEACRDAREVEWPQSRDRGRATAQAQPESS